MKKTLLKSAVAALAGIGLMAGSAMAMPMLTISSGSTSVTVTTATALPGGGTEVKYDGLLGTTDLSVYGSGISYDTPEMHLTALLKSGVGMVTWEYSNSFDSLNAGEAGFVSSFNGAPSGADATFNATINGVEIANFDSFGPPDQFFAGPFASSDEYTFVLTGTINKTNPDGSVSFDANVAPVPEPATMLLFGTGLVGLVGVARRRKAKK
jgi:hypothetical protein